MIPAGSLNRKLQIFQPAAVTRSPTGVEKRPQASETTVYAARYSYTVKDAARAAGPVEQIDAVFVIRFRAGISAECELNCEGQQYAVEKIEEIGFREGLRLFGRVI